jgi:hypothetical protein
MMLRVRALWTRSRPVMTAATFLCLLNIVNFIGIMSYSLATAIIRPSTFPFTGCSFMPSFRQWYIIFIVAIIFETLVIALTVIKVWPVLRNRQTRLPLFTILVQDGLVFYFSTISIHFVVLFTGLFADLTIALAIFGTLPATAVTGVACNRLLLRLQGVLLESTIIGTDIEMTPVGVSAGVHASDTVAITTREEVWNISQAPS